MRLEFSPKSLADLQSILEFIARDKPRAAVHFVDQLEQRCRLLTEFPHLGTSREDLVAALRVFSYRGYGIYYRSLADCVRIERVLHPGLDVREDLFE